MVIRPTRFNIYLLCLIFAVATAGCRSPEKRREKQVAALRIHLEVSDDGMTEKVPIYRANPIELTVARNPFLIEPDIAEAKVVTDQLGGFSLQVKFDTRGTHLLEQYTAMNPGRRLAIFAEFGDKPVQQRWLAAPVIPRRISSGTLTFTPDATKDEAEQIVRGWNNVAIKVGNQPKPKKTKAKPE